MNEHLESASDHVEKLIEEATEGISSLEGQVSELDATIEDLQVKRQAALERISENRRAIAAAERVRTSIQQQSEFTHDGSVWVNGVRAEDYEGELDGLRIVEALAVVAMRNGVTEFSLDEAVDMLAEAEFRTRKNHEPTKPSMADALSLAVKSGEVLKPSRNCYRIKRRPGRPRNIK